jgi:hypothetical protein
MSKQLTLSAALATFVMAAFVVFAVPVTNETGATSNVAAPAFKAALPTR